MTSLFPTYFKTKAINSNIINFQLVYQICIDQIVIKFKLIVIFIINFTGNEGDVVYSGRRSSCC